MKIEEIKKSILLKFNFVTMLQRINMLVENYKEPENKYSMYKKSIYEVIISGVRKIDYLEREKIGIKEYSKIIEIKEREKEDHMTLEINIENNILIIDYDSLEIRLIDTIDTEFKR